MGPIVCCVCSWRRRRHRKEYTREWGLLLKSPVTITWMYQSACAYHTNASNLRDKLQSIDKWHVKNEESMKGEEGHSYLGEQTHLVRIKATHSRAHWIKTRYSHVRYHTGMFRLPRKAATSPIRIRLWANLTFSTVGSKVNKKWAYIQIQKFSDG